MGLAQSSEFLLARTERVLVENESEEELWLMAMEWADANGADIINTSLGYTSDEYYNYQMDGETSLIARAVNLAAKKGILVLVSAGNSGDEDWKYIATPADADSALTVGAVTGSGLHRDFSSFGPTSDKSYLSLEIDTNFFSSNCAICDIQKASIGSVMSKTSTSLDLKPSKWGLDCACFRVSAVR